jgi:hypothetical protein
MATRVERSNELLDDLVEADLVTKRASAARLQKTLLFADHQQDFAELEAEVTRRRNLVAFVADEIAVALNVDVRSVQNTLHRARLVRALLPHTWLAFGDGHLDAYAVQQLGEIAGRLTLTESFERFDPVCAAYAADHNGATTIVWAKRQIEALEPWAAEEASADEAQHELWFQLPTQMALEAERALSTSPASRGVQPNCASTWRSDIDVAGNHMRMPTTKTA